MQSIGENLDPGIYMVIILKHEHSPKQYFWSSIPPHGNIRPHQQYRELHHSAYTIQEWLEEHDASELLWTAWTI